MAVPRWPAELPQRVLADGYAETLGDDRLSTSVDVGPPRTRFRGRSATQVECSIYISYAQKALLERFWREDIKGRSLPFLIPAQSSDAVSVADEGFVDLADEDDNPLIYTESWLVLMGEQPRFTAFGLEFQCSFSLIVMPE